MTASRRSLLRKTVLVLAVLLAAAVVLHLLSGADVFGSIDAQSGNWAYVALFFSVFGDALIPLLPSESALNAASALAAAGSLDLGLIMLAGALGAVLGDSALYWVARASRRRVEPQVEKAKANDKIATALDYIGSSAPLLIVAGRYVPGLRFVINATMGLSEYPYRRFLPWSVLGGTLWAVYTCGLGYLVGTAFVDFPLASAVISGAITTAAIGAIFLVMRRRRSGEAGSTVSVGG